MIDIAAMVPQQGAMCLLGTVVAWDQQTIHCTALSHLDPLNPLRRAGRLGIVCGAEYGMQAAALHGALRDGGSGQAGQAAVLRDLAFHADRLDKPEHGILQIHATLDHASCDASIYGFELRSQDGIRLLSGRATIALTVASAG